jgi:poly(A) polymerase
VWAWLPCIVPERLETINNNTPRIIPRPEHQISRAQISEAALRVLYGLKKGGYEAYLVGGGVRDLLLGREPKDFDVATDARPEEVRRLFRSCRLVGRRFVLAHVRFGGDVVEVATFRAAHDALDDGADGEALMEGGRILRDNVYGTLEQDAWRRDFTVNGLYYSIRDFSVVDFVNGMEDLRAGLLRLVGDPERRYREDPVRMLRAVRFAAKLGFRIEAATEAPLKVMAPLMEEMPPARLFEEVLKLFHGGSAVQTFELLRHYRLFEALFPDTDRALTLQEQGFPITLVTRALENTDRRVSAGKPVTPAFLFAALLWEPVRLAAEGLTARGMSEVQALQAAAGEVVSSQVARVAIPRRFSIQTREIWSLQPRFRYTRGKRPQRLAEHPRFRAAYDFLVLRAESGEDVGDLAEWWTRFQGEAETPPPPPDAPRKGRRRRPRRRPATA